MASMTLLFFVILFLLQLVNASSMSRFPSSSLTSRSSIRNTTTASPSISYTVHYFEQILDHFNVGNITAFPQRYLIHNNSWTGAPSPIFMYCGNEGDIEWFTQNTGFMFDIAPQFKALLVFPEHRYYGKSMPFGSKKKAYSSSETLAYLSAEQALADFVTLIVDLKKNLSAESSPVVLFGGSYGGMLAAWLRLKYPHIAIGAVASSAPILQFEDIIPTDTFYRIVSEDFKREGEKCFEYIRDSWSAIEDAANQTNGLHSLSNTFHMCSTVSSENEIIDWLESAYSYLAMVNYPYAANFLIPLPAYPIREVCKAIMDPSHENILLRIFAGANVYYNYTGEVKCFDTSDDPHGMSGWNWQACTEMVMPMSSNRSNSMFPESGWSLDEFAESCMSSYGATPRPHWITSEFGGHNIESVLRGFGSNIVFANGLLDPWSGGSVVKDISDSIVALVTEEGGHHLDLRAATEDDPKWLTEQRQVEVNYIKLWLQQYYTHSLLTSL